MLKWKPQLNTFSIKVSKCTNHQVKICIIDSFYLIHIRILLNLSNFLSCSRWKWQSAVSLAPLELLVLLASTGMQEPVAILNHAALALLSVLTMEGARSCAVKAMKVRRNSRMNVVYIILQAYWWCCFSVRPGVYWRTNECGLYPVESLW